MLPGRCSETAMQPLKTKPHTFNLVINLPHGALTPGACLAAIHAAGCLPYRERKVDSDKPIEGDEKQ
jgi:hypothetical protein